MKRVVSIVNLKGGVGKTTTAVNIAACWGEMGKNVLTPRCVHASSNY
jgi:chromosome partitioning protein